MAGQPGAPVADDPARLADRQAVRATAGHRSCRSRSGILRRQLSTAGPDGRSAGSVADSDRGGPNAPPSNEDIARVAVGALLDPHRHDGRAYRPTGPTLLSGAEIADAVGEALGRKVRHIDIPPWMFMRAVRVNAKRLGADRSSSSRATTYRSTRWEPRSGRTHYCGPRCRRCRTRGLPDDRTPLRHEAEARRSAGNFIRYSWQFLLTGLVPMHRLDRFERRQQHPRPTHPRLSGQSTFWRNEHVGPTEKSTAFAYQKDRNDRLPDP